MENTKLNLQYHQRTIGAHTFPYKKGVLAILSRVARALSKAVYLLVDVALPFAFLSFLYFMFMFISFFIMFILCNIQTSVATFIRSVKQQARQSVNINQSNLFCAPSLKYVALLSRSSKVFLVLAYPYYIRCVVFYAGGGSGGGFYSFLLIFSYEFVTKICWFCDSCLTASARKNLS